MGEMWDLVRLTCPMLYTTLVDAIYTGTDSEIVQAISTFSHTLSTSRQLESLLPLTDIFDVYKSRLQYLKFATSGGSYTRFTWTAESFNEALASMEALKLKRDKEDGIKWANTILGTMSLYFKDLQLPLPEGLSNESVTRGTFRFNFCTILSANKQLPRKQ